MADAEPARGSSRRRCTGRRRARRRPASWCGRTRGTRSSVSSRQFRRCTASRARRRRPRRRAAPPSDGARCSGSRPPSPLAPWIMHSWFSYAPPAQVSWPRARRRCPPRRAAAAASRLGNSARQSGGTGRRRTRRRRGRLRIAAPPERRLARAAGRSCCCRRRACRRRTSTPSTCDWACTARTRAGARLRREGSGAPRCAADFGSTEMRQRRCRSDRAPPFRARRRVRARAASGELDRPCRSGVAAGVHRRHRAQRREGGRRLTAAAGSAAARAAAGRRRAGRRAGRRNAARRRDVAAPAAARAAAALVRAIRGDDRRRVHPAAARAGAGGTAPVARAPLVPLIRRCPDSRVGGRARTSAASTDRFADGGRAPARQRAERWSCRTYARAHRARSARLARARLSCTRARRFRERHQRAAQAVDASGAG